MALNYVDELATTRGTINPGNIPATTIRDPSRGASPIGPPLYKDPAQLPRTADLLAGVRDPSRGASPFGPPLFKDETRLPRAGDVPDTTNEFIFDETLRPYSGLPESYRDQLLSFLMPQLQESITGMEGNIDQYTQSALGTYRQEFDRYIKDAIPQQIGNLANRGILSSSVAENALSQTYSDALRKSSGMGYQTAMEAAKMKTQIPQTIGQLLQYGQYSEDPTVMSRTLASLLQRMMP